jgi:cytoskeletal protein CcmA (bactofilin family)
MAATTAPASVSDAAKSGRPDAPAPPSYLAPDLIVRGRLDGEGTVEIDGVVEGEVTVGTAVIAAGGRVRATLDADDAVISGNLAGILKARSVTFTDGCHFEGEVQYERIGCEPDAELEAIFVPVIGGNARTHVPGTRALGDPRPVRAAAPQRPAAGADRRPGRSWVAALGWVVLLAGGATLGAMVVSPMAQDWRASLLDALPAVPASRDRPSPPRATDETVPAAPDPGADTDTGTGTGTGRDEAGQARPTASPPPAKPAAADQTPKTSSPAPKESGAATAPAASGPTATTPPPAEAKTAAPAAPQAGPGTTKTKAAPPAATTAEAEAEADTDAVESGDGAKTPPLAAGAKTPPSSAGAETDAPAAAPPAAAADPGPAPEPEPAATAAEAADTPSPPAPATAGDAAAADTPSPPAPSEPAAPAPASSAEDACAWRLQCDSLTGRCISVRECVGN